MPCPACGRADHRAMGVTAGFAVGRCRGCGTVAMVDPPPAPSTDFYAGYYGEGALAVPEFVAGRLDEIVASFAPFRREGRLLDVGCGAGSLLEAAARAGWAARGVEVSANAVAALASRFDVVHGELSSAALPDAAFDVVTMVEVIEHAHDPLTLLRDTKRVLRPGGLLFATTPHSRGVSVRILGIDSTLVCPPEHVQLLSIRGARSLLRRAGLESVTLRTTGANPYELMARLRRRRDGAPSATERVESAYALNEALLASRPRRLVKRALNAALRVSRLGDSLTIRAAAPSD